MKKRVKLMIAVIGFMAVIIIIGSVLISSLNSRLETYLEEVEITNVDLTRVADGTYTSRVNTGVIIVELEVDVKNHVITDIRLTEHRNGQGQDAEQIIPRIIEEQRIDVDTISGATYSSLVIQDAVSRALR